MKERKRIKKERTKERKTERQKYRKIKKARKEERKKEQKKERTKERQKDRKKEKERNRKKQKEREKERDREGERELREWERGRHRALGTDVGHVQLSAASRCMPCLRLNTQCTLFRLGTVVCCICFHFYCRTLTSKRV